MKTRRRFHPGFETLETRLVPAVTFTQGDFDNNGTNDLSILGDDGPQLIRVTEDPVAGITFLLIDANGDGDFTDPGDTDNLELGEFETISVATADGVDEVVLFATDVFNGEQRSYLIDLGESDGPGQRLSTAFRSFTGGSSIALELQGGSRDDLVRISPQSIDASSFAVNLDVGAGDNTVEVNANAALNIVVSNGATFDLFIETDTSNKPGNDLVDFDMGLLADAASSINIDAKLFAGNDTFTSSFGNGTLRVGDGASGITGFNLSVDGGDGNDLIRASLDTTKCTVGDTGYCRFDFRGGTGADVIELIQPTTTNTGRMAIRGLWELLIDGGRGKDAINVDLNERPATGDLDLRAGGVFRLNTRGGRGQDAITVNLSNGETATVPQGAYDIALFGNKGDDTITFNLDNKSTSAVSFGPGGAILFDGGVGAADVLNLTSTGAVTTHSQNVEL